MYGSGRHIIRSVADAGLREKNRDYYEENVPRAAAGYGEKRDGSGIIPYPAESHDRSGSSEPQCSPTKPSAHRFPQEPV